MDEAIRILIYVDALAMAAFVYAAFSQTQGRPLMIGTACVLLANGSALIYLW